MGPVAAPKNGSPAVPHLHRYYGLVRLLSPHPERLRSPLVVRYLIADMAEEKESSPGFLGSPCGSVPRARDSGGSGRPRDSGRVDTAFRQAKGVGIRHGNNAFGAESSRPASSLCTLRPTGRPGRRNTRYRPARYGFDRAGFPPAGLHRSVSLAHERSSNPKLVPARYLCGSYQIRTT